MGRRSRTLSENLISMTSPSHNIHKLYANEASGNFLLSRHCCNYLLLSNSSLVGFAYLEQPPIGDPILFLVSAYSSPTLSLYPTCSVTQSHIGWSVLSPFGPWVCLMGEPRKLQSETLVNDANPQDFGPFDNTHVSGKTQQPETCWNPNHPYESLYESL